MNENSTRPLTAILSAAYLLLLLALFFVWRAIAPGSLEGQESAHSGSHKRSPQGDTSSSRANGPGAAGSASNRAFQATSQKRPAPAFQTDPEKLFSAFVSAEIQAGETLVMGGYRKPDGSHEFTLLTPAVITTDNGEQQIMLKSSVLAIGPDFAKASGMDSLTTPSRTADGRAEAWKRSTLQSTMESASQSEGFQVMAAPRISARPGEPFSFTVGEEGGAGYSIEATVTQTESGNFSMEVLTERNPGGTH